MRQISFWSSSIALLLASAIFVAPQAAIAQPAGYVVTATLDPIFVGPFTWHDGVASLRPFEGLTRGADGWLYGITESQDAHVFSIMRVNPATGTARVL